MRLALATHYPGCRPVPQVTGADMLSAAPLSACFSQGGKWGAELEEMFVNSVLPGNAEGNVLSVWQTPSTGLTVCALCSVDSDYKWLSYICDSCRAPSCDALPAPVRCCTHSFVTVLVSLLLQQCTEMDCCNVQRYCSCSLTVTEKAASTRPFHLGLCDSTERGRGRTAAEQRMPEVEQMHWPLEEDAAPEAGAAAADIDLPDHTANDIFMLEEEVEVER